jgi:hypothetical protein
MVQKTPTEARQGSARTANFRVLIISTLATVLVLGGFAIAFWMKTPAQVQGVENNAAQDQPSRGTPPEPKPLPK